MYSLIAVSAIITLLSVVYVVMASVPAQPPACVDPVVREQARVLMQEGLDAALKRHTTRLFDTALKDRTDQPERALNGLANGLTAYARAQNAVRDWNPTPCP